MDKAIENFKGAIEKKKGKASPFKIANAFNNLAIALFEAGEPEEAMREYDAAIRLEPSPCYFNNRGLAHYHQGRLEEAYEDFTVALDKQ